MWFGFEFAAPKRKKPRPVKYEDENPSAFTVRNNPISSTTKVEMDQSAKTDTSPNLEKNSGSAPVENGSKGTTAESESGGVDVGVTKEEPPSPKKESTAGLRLDDDRRDNFTVTKV